MPLRVTAFADPREWRQRRMGALADFQLFPMLVLVPVAGLAGGFCWWLFNRDFAQTRYSRPRFILIAIGVGFSSPHRCI